MKTPSLTRHDEREMLNLGEMNILWITDPWSTLDHSQDTTLRLMLEAINMGIPTFWSASDQLFSSQKMGHILAVEFKKGMPLDFSNVKLELMPLSSFQQIHNRIDPPVDENYRKIIDDLLYYGAKPAQILNPPNLLKNQSEKIPPSDLIAYTPRLLLVQKENDLPILEKLFSRDLEVVSKPLHLLQSIGVKKHVAPKTSSEWKELIAHLTENFTQQILIEEYLPEIDQGEVRMWFAGEHFIAALKKYPKSGDFRVLIDEGSRVTSHTLTEEEAKISKEIGASLKKQGIFLAAIDLIGNKICDYNITSPGLLVQLEKVHGGKNFAREVLNQALRFRAPSAHE